MKLDSIFTKTTIFYVTIFTVLSVIFLPLTTFADAISNGMNASYVLGQADFVSNIGTTTQSGFDKIEAVLYDNLNSRLFAADGDNNRVLVFDLSGGISNGMNASYVLGQADFVSNIGTTTQAGLSAPAGLALSGNTLFVADEDNHRVVTYDVATITNGEDAVNVLGQGNFTDNSASNEQDGLDGPQDLEISGNTLFVADDGNNRVVTFDISTIIDGENAQNVLGKLGFATSSPTGTQNGLNDASGLALKDNLLFVSDESAHRVMVFDVSTVTDGENAVNVLGQPDFMTYDGTVTQSGLHEPAGLHVNNELLFVAEPGEGSRVTVFDISTITNGENAQNVLGAPDFVTITETTTQNDLDGPSGVTYDTTNDYLFVSEQKSNRVLIFDLSEDGGCPEGQEEGGEGECVPVASSGFNYTHPPLCEASITPSTVVHGESATLSWSHVWPTDRRGIFYARVPGPDGGLFSNKVNSVTINPDRSSDYVLAIFNLWGANFCEASVEVLDENGEVVSAGNTQQYTAGASNHPFIRPIVAFFAAIFVR